MCVLKGGSSDRRTVIPFFGHILPCVVHSFGGCVLAVVPGRAAVPDEAVATPI